MNDNHPIAVLSAHLALLSLLAIGGINTIIPEMHRVFVLQKAWLSEEEFTSLFALAQAAPGPNLLFMTLVGWKLGGVFGGLLATAAFCTPSFLLAYGTARIWAAWGQVRWFRRLQRGLVPLTIGLVAASAWLLTSAASSSSAEYVITAAVAVVALTTRLNPILILAAAGLVGLAGLA